MAGGPYASKLASIGGVPTVPIDVPISAVFMVIFIIGAASHMTILQTNLRRNHKFRASGMMFGYCMARTVTCIMRIVWATRPDNVRVAIAANIFSNAGVFIAYLINIILAQRVVVSAFPSAGQSKPFKMAFVLLYAITILTLASVITSVVQSVYTLDTYIHSIDRDIQLTAGTLILVIAALPIPLTVASVLRARRTPPTPFGTGSWNAKIVILMVTTLLALTVAAFRCGTTWMTPRPKEQPYWFDARWCYYFFNFVFDISIIYTYLFTRVDKRFHILGKDEMVSEEEHEDKFDDNADQDGEKSDLESTCA
ncbi:hypothetical protein MBLNU459_g6291t1 [Dothideomycetes sp. NU459]